MVEIGWRDALEILIFWFGIYGILRFLSGTRGLGILKGGFGVVVALYVVSKALETQLGITLPRFNYLIESLVTVALIAFVIIFQPELRRGLTRLGEKPFAWFGTRVMSQTVSPIVEAAGRLSKRRIGALIVLERGVGIGTIVENGVPVNAEVTATMLESIFYPNAPLHDGAAVIRGDRIVAACCLLPLSDSPVLGPEVGTRHRAATGLSEETDCLCIVVSEHTGRISIAHHGVLRPVRDTRELEEWIGRILGGAELDPPTSSPATVFASKTSIFRRSEVESGLEKTRLASMSPATPVPSDPAARTAGAAAKDEPGSGGHKRAAGGDG